MTTNDETTKDDIVSVKPNKDAKEKFDEWLKYNDLAFKAAENLQKLLQNDDVDIDDPLPVSVYGEDISKPREEYTKARDKEAQSWSIYKEEMKKDRCSDIMKAMIANDIKWEWDRNEVTEDNDDSTHRDIFLKTEFAYLGGRYKAKARVRGFDKKGLWEYDELAKQPVDIRRVGLPTKFICKDDAMGPHTVRNQLRSQYTAQHDIYKEENKNKRNSAKRTFDNMYHIYDEGEGYDAHGYNEYIAKSQNHYALANGNDVNQFGFGLEAMFMVIPIMIFITLICVVIGCVVGYLGGVFWKYNNDKTNTRQDRDTEQDESV